MHVTLDFDLKTTKFDCIDAIGWWPASITATTCFAKVSSVTFDLTVSSLLDWFEIIVAFTCKL